MNEQTENELTRLNSYQEICREALNEFATNNPFKLPAYEKEKIEKLLYRMFDGETDFLVQNSDDYFEIYGEE